MAGTVVLVPARSLSVQVPRMKVQAGGQLSSRTCTRLFGKANKHILLRGMCGTTAHILPEPFASVVQSCIPSEYWFIS